MFFKSGNSLKLQKPLQDNKGIWAEMKVHINVLRTKPK